MGSPNDLELIDSIILQANPKSHSILILSTYRSNEVDETHFLPRALSRLHKQDIVYHEIHLGPLSHSSISDMIKDTIRLTTLSHDFDLSALSEWIYSKTHGNAFFSTQMLQSLHSQGSLYFDFDHRKWHFKIPEVDTLPETVVELIGVGLQRLPSETQEVVKLASCLGSSKFELGLLAVVYGRSMEETAKDLWPALKDGLVVPMTNAYQIPLAIEVGSELALQWRNNAAGFDEDKANTNIVAGDKESDQSSSSTKASSMVITYRFLHDNVQESALALIPEDERASVHALIGRRMLSHMRQEEKVDKHIFEICNQLNHAKECLSDAEHEELIELNLQAGRKALRSMASDVANGHFQISMDLLGHNPWERNREVTLNVWLAEVERLYAAAQFEAALPLIEEGVQHSETPVEYIPFLLKKMDCELSMANPGAAFETGIKYFLSTLDLTDRAAQMLELGSALPLGDENAEEFAKLMSSQISLAETTILDIADLPIVEDPEILLLQEVLGKLSMSSDEASNVSPVFLRFSPSASQSCLLLVVLSYPEVRCLGIFCMYRLLLSF